MAVGRELLTTYSAGTIALTPGSTIARGAGVYWLDVWPADTLIVGDREVTIASVDSDGFSAIELASPWQGDAAEAADYKIRFDAPSRFPGYMAHTAPRAVWVRALAHGQ